MEKIIIEQFTIKKKKIEKFIQSATLLIEKSNYEEGCITYRLLNDTNDPTKFIIYGRFTDEKAIEIHASSKHLKKFIKSSFFLFSDKPVMEVLSQI